LGHALPYSETPTIALIQVTFTLTSSFSAVLSLGLVLAFKPDKLKIISGKTTTTTNNYNSNNKKSQTKARAKDKPLFHL